MRRKITYDPDRDYYTVLGIDTGATTAEVRLAYRRAVREVHPDLNPDRAEWATEQLQLVNEAYTVLGDATHRKEYDRLRWPHIPAAPTSDRRSYRSPYSAPFYDPDRPWWEQAAPYGTRGSRRQRAYAAHTAESAVDPVWIAVAAWLRRHHLGALESTWLTLVGLWRSPYAGILIFLGVVLSINVAVIVYAFIDPPADGSLFEKPGFIQDIEDWLRVESQDGTPPALLTLPPTQDSLQSPCEDPDVQIEVPRPYDVVPDSFAVYGTVRHPDMLSYTVEIAHIGPVPQRQLGQPIWQPVRTPPANQSVREQPFENQRLTEANVDLSGAEAGYYVIRLRVNLLRVDEYALCDVVVQLRPGE